MKRIVLLMITAYTLLLGGCETTKEITLKDDGSGTMNTTTDMSSLVSMIKMSGQAGQLDKMGDKKVDTSFSTESLLSQATSLSADDMELAKKGSLGLIVDMANEKIQTKLSFPFTNGNQISQLDKITSEVTKEFMKKQMDSVQTKMPAGAMPGGGMPSGSIDDYYIMSYSKGVIERKLNKEKYANLDADEGMKALKETSSMGMGSGTIVINLPSAAKKTTGKKLTLSDDKKVITISNSAGDFFDDAAALEFKIEY